MYCNEISIETWRDRHGRKAVVESVKRILAGEVVKFNSYERELNNSAKLIHCETVYIGLSKIEGEKALRKSHCEDLEAHLSHSLIPSWEPENAIDPIHIGVAIVEYFNGKDIFTNY